MEFRVTVRSHHPHREPVVTAAADSKLDVSICTPGCRSASGEGGMQATRHSRPSLEQRSEEASVGHTVSVHWHEGPG